MLQVRWHGKVEAMRRAAGLSRIFVVTLPLAFVVWSWFSAAGFPYYLDNNETFLSYVHARNLELWNPWQYAWMTAEATDPQAATSGHFYTHNPNAPRYLHYALLMVGVRELSSQLLIIALVGTGLTVWLLLRLFRDPVLTVVPLAVAVDFGGFLAWTVNTYRVWTFVLYFGMALAVVRRRLRWLGVLTFAVYQVEYGLALCLSVTMAVLAVFLDGRRAWRQVAAMGVGGGLSLAVFFAQVLGYYGWNGLFAEIAATLARRGAVSGQGSGPTAYLAQMWYGMLTLLSSIGVDTYNRPVVIIVIAGLIIAAVMLVRGRYQGTRRFMAALAISTLAGMAATSMLLYGYFVDAYAFSLLPLAVFLVSSTAGVLGIEVHDALVRLKRSPHVALIGSLLVLLPVIVASVDMFRPPMAVTLFHLLQTEYRGRTIIAPNFGPWMANEVLAFTLTGGRAFRTSDLEPTPDDLRRYAAVREADSSLTYLCLDTLFLRNQSLASQRHNQADTSVCDIATGRMIDQGHELLVAGEGWSILRVQADEQTLSVAERGGLGR
jgi:hypothetical protein